jgi:hypothetical protein
MEANLSSELNKRGLEGVSNDQLMRTQVELLKIIRSDEKALKPRKRR